MTCSLCSILLLKLCVIRLSHNCELDLETIFLCFYYKTFSNSKVDVHLHSFPIFYLLFIEQLAKFSLEHVGK